MQLLTKIISFLSSLTYGVVLTNLPVEIFDKLGEITHFDSENPTITSIVEFGFLAGAAIGSLCTTLYADKLGYVKSLRLVFLLEVLASGATIIPIHWAYLALIRIINGICAVGMLVLAPQLVAEVLSPKDRGFTMMLFSIALNLGNEIAYAIHLPIAFNYDYWWVTFVLPMILSAIGALCAHLLIANQKKIKDISSQRQDMMMKENIEEGQLENHNVQTGPTDKESLNNIVDREKSTEKLTKKQFARLLFVTITLGATPTLDGVDAILTYASGIFTNTFSVPHSGIYGSLILGAANIICAIIATPFAERNPRKRMLMIGVIGIVTTLFGIGVIYLLKLSVALTDILVLILIMFYLLFFNVGPQPIVFMFFGEMFPDLYKVKLNGIGYTALLGASVAMVYAFAYFQDGLEAYIYFIYGILTLLCGVSGTMLAPETYNKTLPDIEKIIRTWGVDAKELERRRMAEIEKMQQQKQMDALGGDDDKLE